MFRYLKPYRGKNTSHIEEWAIYPQSLHGMDTSLNPLKKGVKRHESLILNTQNIHNSYQVIPSKYIKYIIDIPLTIY